MDLVNVLKALPAAIAAVTSLFSAIAAFRVKKGNQPAHGQKAAIDRLFNITIASLFLSVLAVGLAFTRDPAEKRLEQRVMSDIARNVKDCVVAAESEIEQTLWTAANERDQRGEILKSIGNHHANLLKSLDATQARAYAILASFPEFSELEEPLLKTCHRLRTVILPKLGNTNEFQTASLITVRNDILGEFTTVRKELDDYLSSLKDKK